MMPHPNPPELRPWIGRHLGPSLQECCAEAPPCFAGADWVWRVGQTGDPGTPGGLTWTCRAEVVSGRAEGIAVGAELLVADWSRDCHLLVPGAVYAGNRFESLPALYSPRYPAERAGPEALPLVADIPRLSTAGEAATLAWKSGESALPAVGWFDPRAGCATLLLVSQIAEAPETGFLCEENAAGDRLRLRVMTPGVRPRRYRHMQRAVPSADTGANLDAGQALSLSLRVWTFPAEDVQALHDRLFDLRSLAGPATPPATLPWSEAWRLVVEHYDRDMWDEEAGLYRTDCRPGTRHPYQTGWCGGLIAEYALDGSARLGASTRARVTRHLDVALSAGVARPAGLLHGKYAPAVGWASDFWFETETRPWTSRWTLVRRQGDALLYLLRLLEAREALGGPAAPPSWVHTTRGLAEALVTIWKRAGQFGQFIDQWTGDVLVGNSTSGAIIPAALVRAAERFGDPEMLSVAEAAARHYRDHDLTRGVTTGGPADALQAPDSESIASLVESFVELWEVTGERSWLDAAGWAARQLASWVMAHDHPFPPDSVFGRLGMRTAGTIFANAQNRGATPGICTHSGLGLLKLFRASGDVRYLRLLESIARALPQFVSRADRPIVANDGRILPSGWINERVNTNDWDDNIGGVFFGPCWCEVSLLLTIRELPGVYAQPDTGVLATLDHVEAGWDDGGLLRLRNPTRFDAEVTVHAESAQVAAERHWGLAGAQDFLRVRVPAGGEARVGTVRRSVP
jgi:hypothetical protein